MTIILAFFKLLLGHIPFLALHLDSGSFPRPLSAAQEQEAFVALAHGTEAEQAQARERIIQHNLRLVAHIAKKYYAAPGDSEDFISIGTIGLIKAVNTFDYTKRVRFSTYASRCIENEIRMHLRSQRKEPQSVSLQDALEAGKGGESDLTVQDLIPDEFCMEENCEQRDLTQQVRRMIDQLAGRERQIMILRYGLSGQPPQTQQQVADILGISRSYVSRIETRALGELRTHFTGRGE